MLRLYFVVVQDASLYRFALRSEGGELIGKPGVYLR
jgi:hypothetical protein